MNEWKEYRLKEITTRITKGTTPSTIGGAFIANGINFIKSESVSYNGKIDKSTFAYISEKTHDKLRRSQLEKNDILFSMAGIYLGKSGFVTDEILPANTNQALAIIKVDPAKAIPKFIHYVLQQKSVIEFVNTISGQSAQPNINMEEIGSIELLLPPIPEQEHITEVLSSIDDKIDLLHQNNKTLDQLAETLFKKWFVEEVETDWKQVKLNDIIEHIESGSRPKGGIDPELKEGIPSIGAENINGIGIYDYTRTKFITLDFFKSMKRGLIKNYDVLIYKDGAYVGKKGMFGNGFPYEIQTINEHVFILRGNNKINQFFLYYLLKEDELALLNTNSAQPGLNQDSIKSFEITLPPLYKVSEFGDTIKPWIDKILENGKQIYLLSKIRETLLPKLMSGTLRVENLKSIKI